MGWGEFIEKRLVKIRNIYNALRKIYHTIPVEKRHIRKQLFCAFGSPHFFWLFSTWFFYTENQMQKIEQMYCACIRLINNLWGWNDHMTLIISQEKSLLDHLYAYWQKFTKHLIESPEGNEYREIWEAYLISKAPDEKFYKTIGVRKNNFMNR